MGLVPRLQNHTAAGELIIKNIRKDNNLWIEQVILKRMTRYAPGLFIPFLNDLFQKQYPPDAKVSVLYLTTRNTSAGRQETAHKALFLLRLGRFLYSFECGETEDGSYILCISESPATWNSGSREIPVPVCSLVYIDSTSHTPEKTEFRYKFPDGHSVSVERTNLVLARLTKEELIQRKIFPLIPFFVMKYAEPGNGSDQVISEEFRYFNNQLSELHKEEILSASDLEVLFTFIHSAIDHLAFRQSRYVKLHDLIGVPKET